MAEKEIKLLKFLKEVTDHLIHLRDIPHDWKKDLMDKFVELEDEIKDKQ